MTPAAERLIRASWAMLVPVRLEAAARFYERLFEIDPSAKALFDGMPTHAQREKFLHTIDTLVQALDYPPRIIDDMQALAKRHVGYGVHVVQYESVGEALLWSLAHSLGEAWTDDVARAWTELYAFIAGVMRRAVTPT